MDMTQNSELNQKYRKQAADLVAQMTLQEKCGQVTSWAIGVERLGIKAYNWWNEALHGVARAGVATVFPQAITTAGSFDEDLVEEIADVISTEGRAKYNLQQKYNDTDIYKGLTFWSPNVNIFRDPRWGRGHETYGEDPYLTSRLGVRFVKGIQGHDEKYMKAAACAKHYAVHSGPEDMRHYFNAVCSTTDLYETYLPAFKTCVQEGKVETVMGAYNRTNGEPCNGSETLLKKILREQLGFEGHVVSDCWAIKDFHEGHKVTEGPRESVAMAANNGCDLNCGDMFHLLQGLVEDGTVPESRLDEMVINLFTTRMKMGTLGEVKDNPYDQISYLEVDTPAHKALNRKAATQSLVLLKNENNILPLNKKDLKVVGVVGPNANNRKALIGNYEGTASSYVTVLEGIQQYLGDDVRVLFSEGCHLFKDRVEPLGVANDRMSEVKGICDASDVVICVMGLDAGLEGEEGDQGNAYASGDKNSLDLPGLQEEVLKAVVESGKPAIMVLMSGSALTVNYAQENIPGILYAGYPGAQGGVAVADLLFGEACPEGKLPITFYKTLEELPDFTEYAMKDRTYRYMKNEALYPFGYGLSYTTFEVTNVAADTGVLTEDGITVEADVTNIGSMAGGEAIQVYVKVEKEGTPNAQLKGIKKVHLAPGEMEHVSIKLPATAFGLFGEDAKKVAPAGTYSVYVGTSQPDSRSKALTGVAPAKLSICSEKDYVVE